MTNESTHNDIDFDAADPEMERLLAEVYDAPPIPRSLLKSIDRGVEDQWGQSPGLVVDPSVVLSRSFVLTQGWVRAIPVAACVLVAAVLFLAFANGSGGHAWATMIEAIAGQGVLQIKEPDGVRWLSLADGVMGRQSSDHDWMLDSRQRVTLTRRHSDQSVQRQRFADSLPVATDQQMLVWFLAGDSLNVPPQSLAGLRVVSEAAEQISAKGDDQVWLRMKFQTDAQAFDLDVSIDPQTSLPLACEIDSAGGQARVSTVSLASASVSDLRRQSFPADLQVVEIDSNLGDGEMVAASLAFGPEKNVEVPDRAVIGETAPVTANVTAANLLKSTTAWKPVKVSHRSRDEVLQYVDDVLVKLWQSKDVTPTEPAGDEELMRRVYLDLAGRTPSVSEIRAYLNEPAAGRYERLVDRLLASPDHASHLATMWRMFLIPDGVDLTAFGGVEAFDKWLADQFASDQSYDQIVRSLLVSEGRLSRSGPLLFYSAAKLNPDQLASRTSRVFLGMRMECAQCHDHPFEPWTQEDFWSYAAFFARISRPQGELENASRVLRVHDIDEGEVMLPETETIVPPRFLDKAPYDGTVKADARRTQLADWMTSPTNPYFARATANRVWGKMFGVGIVNPIDDFGEMNPPISPELLDTLASRLIDTGFDLQDLFRVVALSRAYRLSSGAATADEGRLRAFARMSVKTLTAEQVYDCITVATMLQPKGTTDPYQFNVNRFGNSSREQFLLQFRTPSQDRTSYQAGIPQALTLMNGSLIAGATEISSSGLLSSLEAPFFTNQQRIEVLYLATLSRHPSVAEQEMLKDFVEEDATGETLQQGMADLLWVLLNSAEFTLNH